MKKAGKYLLYICNTVLICLIIFNIFSYDLKTNETSISALDSDGGRYISYLEKDNVEVFALDNVIIEKEEVVVEKHNIETQQPIEKIEINNEIPVASQPKEEVEVKEEIIEQPKEEVKENIAIETLTGNLAGYGPDCYGCTSNKTASGKYIGEGNIYYEDETYGKVRIVAGDYSYPFGTIVRISNVDFYNDEPFYAVVLDRGGDIGKNKKFMFDLLFASEKETLPLGKKVNIKFEILRLGY